MGKEDAGTKEERRAAPHTGRSDSKPRDEPIPPQLPVFFPPYTQQPVSPAVTQLLFADPDFADITPAEVPPSLAASGADGDCEVASAGVTGGGAPSCTRATEDASGSSGVGAPRGSSTCASPITPTAIPTYEPEEDEQAREQEALREFAALLDAGHPGLDDAITPTGPLPPQCDRAQFLIARDLARLRFIRARKLNAAEAVKMYVAAMEWRKEERVDAILNDPDPMEILFHCVCPHRNHGFDRFGHPIYWEKTGGVRMPRFLDHITEDDIVRRHVRMMEHTIRRCMFSSALNGRNVEKMTLVMDMADMQYTIETTGIRAFKRTTKIDQLYYPERLFKMFIINAPLSFRGVWAMVRPWLDPKTQTKISVIGSKYLPALQEVIHPDHIPRSLGGNCECSYPNGDSCLQKLRTYPDPDTCGGWQKVF